MSIRSAPIEKPTESKRSIWVRVECTCSLFIEAVQWPSNDKKPVVSQPLDLVESSTLAASTVASASPSSLPTANNDHKHKREVDENDEEHDGDRFYGLQNEDDDAESSEHTLHAQMKETVATTHDNADRTCQCRHSSSITSMNMRPISRSSGYRWFTCVLRGEDESKRTVDDSTSAPWPESEWSIEPKTKTCSIILRSLRYWWGRFKWNSRSFSLAALCQYYHRSRVSVFSMLTLGKGRYYTSDQISSAVSVLEGVTVMSIVDNR